MHITTQGGDNEAVSNSNEWSKSSKGKGIDDVTLIWIDPRRGCHKRGGKK